MKLSTVLSVILIFYYVVHSSTLSLVEPIEFALQRYLNMTSADFESKCSTQYAELAKLKSVASSFGTTLYFTVSEKLPNPKSSDGLDALIENDCINNSDLKFFSLRVVQNVKNCLDEILKFDNTMEEETKNAVVNAICAGVRISIEWQIQLRKVMDNQ